MKNINQSMKVLNVSRRTIEKWIVKGELPGAVKDLNIVPPAWRIPIESLEQKRLQMISQLQARIEELSIPIT